jgi:hypothetical protein
MLPFDYDEDAMFKIYDVWHLINWHKGQPPSRDLPL